MTYPPRAADARTFHTAQWIIVGLLVSFSVISYFDRTIMSIAGPQMMKDFGVSPTEMGSVYSAFVLGYALFMIPCGHLTDRLGARQTLGLMGLLSAAFTLLVLAGGKPGLGTYVGIVPALFAIRFGMGVVTAPLYPACAKMTANWIPMVYHGRVQGLIIAGSSIGAATSPLLFTWMLMEFRWRASFALAALGTVVLAIVWFWYARDYPRDQAPGMPVAEPAGARQVSQPSWTRHFANRNLMLITFAYGTLGYYQYIFFYWIYYYFGEVLHLGSQASGRYTAIVFLVEGAIMPLGGLASDRLTRLYGAQFGRRMVPILGLTLSAVLTCAGTASSGTIAAVTLLSLAFGLAACCEGPFWASVTEMAGEQVGSASSILNAGAQIGGVFAPILTPFIAARAGWSWGLYAGGLFLLFGVVAIYFADVTPVSAHTAESAPQST